MLTEKQKQFLKDLEEGHKDKYTSENASVYKSRIKKKYKIMKEDIKTIDKVLELGCGHGNARFTGPHKIKGKIWLDEEKE